jgi:GAF domain-containing protein
VAYLVSREQDLHISASTGFGSKEGGEAEALGQGRLCDEVAQWVVARGESVCIPDLKEEAGLIDREGSDDGDRSMIAVPVISEQILLAVMMVLFEGGFESGHVDLLEAASKQVGLALSNAQRYRQVNRRLAEQSALQQVARVINRRLEMEPLLEEIVNQVRQVLGYEIVEIYLVEEGNLVLRSATGGIEGEHFSLPLTEGVVGRVARTQKAAFVAEVRDDSDYVDGNPETCVEVAVPIMKGSIVIGVLNVESSLPSGLDEEDVDLLLLLADQVSVAIENASLYDRLQRHTDTLEQLVKDRTAALEGALDQARVAERLKTQFVADVSHELRTPLANIQLYLELLSFGNPERFSNYLETLMRETGRPYHVSMPARITWTKPRTTSTS